MRRRVSRDQLRDDVTRVREILGPADPLTAEGQRVAMGAVVTNGRHPGPRRMPGPLRAIALTAAVLLGLGTTTAVIKLATRRTRSSGAASNALVLAAYRGTLAAHSAHLAWSFRSEALSMTADGVVDLTTGLADMTYSLPGPDGPVEEISTDTTIFLRVPVKYRALVGKAWVGFRPRTHRDVMGVLVRASGLGTTFSVTGLVGWLQGVTSAVKRVDTETIQGRRTTHYHVNVDLAMVAARAPLEVRADVEQLQHMLRQHVPFDFWVDGQQRLRKMQASLNLDLVQLPPSQTVTGGLHGIGVETLQLSDFGTPVDITPPPTQDVGDVGRLLAGLGGP